MTLLTLRMIPIDRNPFQRRLRSNEIAIHGAGSREGGGGKIACRSPGTSTALEYVHVIPSFINCDLSRPSFRGALVSACRRMRGPGIHNPDPFRIIPTFGYGFRARGHPSTSAQEPAPRNDESRIW